MPRLRRGDGADRRLIAEHGRTFALPGGSELAVFTGAKFLTVTRQQLGQADRVRAVGLDDLGWLLAEHGPSLRAGRTSSPSGQLPRGGDDSGSDAGFRFACNRVREGLDDDAIREIFEEDESPAGEWWRRCGWPDGFVSPCCGGAKGWALKTKAFTWECAACRRQTSVTAGTVMHGSHLPLKAWFTAIHIVTSHSNGVSALQLQGQLGLGSYKSAAPPPWARTAATPRRAPSRAPSRPPRRCGGDARGAYVERLDLDGLDPASLAGLPVLDGHNGTESRAIVGTVVSARREGDAIVAAMRLSGADDVASVRTKVQEGVIRGLSIGYAVAPWQDGTENGERVRTARLWTVHEISLVATPADATATIRSDTMPNDVPSDRETRAQIRALARAAQLPPEWADALVDAGATVEAARAAAQGAQAARAAAMPHIRITGSHDAPEAVWRRRADALFARVSGSAPSAEARPYMTESLRDMARACLEAPGQPTRGMTADALFRAAMHTTSDFPRLLTSTGSRQLGAAYERAASLLRALSRQVTLADFRPMTRLKLSDVGLLEEVTESGEITHTSRGEAAESIRLKTYASMFALSRQTLVNDDLGAFADWSATAGRMGPRPRRRSSPS